MIELEKHIETLLLHNDCVIVPGLGGFMAHHVEARYVGEDGLFLPPLRTLGFNSQLKLNDSLLIQSYIEAYDISYPEAFRRVEEEVAELKQHLVRFGSHVFNDVGTLYLNAEGVYTFEPCEAGILTPDLYALSSFELSRLSSSLSPSIKLSDNQFFGKLTDEVKLKQTESVTNDNEKLIDLDDDEKEIKIKVAWIRNAVAVAVAILAFFLITPPISNGNVGNIRVSDMGSSYLVKLFDGGNETDTHEYLATTNEVVNTKLETISANSVANIDTAGIVGSQPICDKEKVRIAEASIDSIEYCLVLASMITQKNAETYVKILHIKGFPGATVYKNNDIVRVIYGKYSTETAAYNDLQKLSGNTDFEQAWVYKKR